jgi:hypothetical protein
MGFQAGLRYKTASNPLACICCSGLQIKITIIALVSSAKGLMGLPLVFGFKWNNITALAVKPEPGIGTLPGVQSGVVV